MKNILKKMSVCFVVMFTFLVVGIPAYADTADFAGNKDIMILFTHDLHSHFLPAIDENGEEYGGYARLMTVINEYRDKNPDALLVDGGDFAMGSLFQTAYATAALELRLMGAMGYDATTFGNHEFDYLPEGLISMLNAAKESGDRLPAIVDANYLPSEDDAAMKEALDDYGVKDYIILERGGVYFAIFGIFGIDSDKCAPNSGMVLHDPILKAQETVDKAVAYCVETYHTEPFVICLSHSGTHGGEGEDCDLARGVNGIDMIISAHSHATYHAPLVIDDTYIVSADEYGRFLGVAEFAVNEQGDAALKHYELVPINDAIEEDNDIAVLVETYKKEVEENYLSKYGVSFDEVLVNNHVKFDSVNEMYDTQHESTLGNVFSDAYKKAAEEATGEEIDIALTASGVIRESLPLGKISVSDVFNAASLGVGTEGELVKVYITGKDLKDALEVDASIQPIMDNAQLFCSGVEYSFNTSRMIFNKVDYCALRRNDGSIEKIEDDKLYSIVSGMYVGQMLGAVEEKSFGLLKVVPRDKSGNPIAAHELVNYVIRDENGDPVKEWYAIASYLQSMGGTMDERYETVDGRKIVYASMNPAKLVKNANKFTYAVAALGVMICFMIVSVRQVVKRKIKSK